MKMCQVHGQVFLQDAQWFSRFNIQYRGESIKPQLASGCSTLFLRHFVAQNIPAWRIRIIIKHTSWTYRGVMAIDSKSCEGTWQLRRPSDEQIHAFGMPTSRKSSLSQTVIWTGKASPGHPCMAVKILPSIWYVFLWHLKHFPLERKYSANRYVCFRRYSHSTNIQLNSLQKYCFLNGTCTWGAIPLLFATSPMLDFVHKLFYPKYCIRVTSLFLSGACLVTFGCFKYFNRCPIGKKVDCGKHWITGI